MTRGRGGGRGGRGRGGKKGGKYAGQKREMVYKEEGFEYALVTKLLGGSKMEVQCMDDKKRIAKVPGKFKRRVWVNVGDLVLVSLRNEFNDNECDIAFVYYSDEARTLKAQGEIPQDITIVERQAEQDLNIEFNNDEDEEEDASKKKSDRQNLNDFMPDDSDDEDEEEDLKSKSQAKANEKAKQVTSLMDKLNIKDQPMKKTDRNKKQWGQISEEEEESKSEKEEVDELADI